MGDTGAQNAALLEASLKEGSLARRLVAAYRSSSDTQARRKALEEVLAQRLQELRGEPDGAA